MWRKKAEPQLALETAAEPARRMLPRGALSHADHASAFVGWCQENWIVGDVTAKAMEREHYPKFCADMAWERHSWPLVAAELRKLLGCSKNTTRYRDGQYRIVYPIPPGEKPLFTPAKLPAYPRLASTGAQDNRRVCGELKDGDTAA